MSASEEAAGMFGYRLGKRLYTNLTMGVEVSEAVDSATGTEVVLKVVVPANDFYIVVNDHLNEAMRQKSLDHPSVCQVLRVCLFPHGLLIVLEKLENDLSVVIKERAEAYSDGEALDWLKALVSVLEYAQRKVQSSQNIAHRDVKPQNILVSREGVYKLCDFGAAKLVQDASGSHSIVGTPLYLSPQLREHLVDSINGRVFEAKYDPFKSDVYSLGLTFLYLLRRKPPQELALLPTLAESTVKVISSLPYSEPIKSLLTMMLEIDEAKRPNFVELKSYLETVKLPPKPRAKLQVAPRAGEYLTLPRLPSTQPMHCGCCNGNAPANYYVTSKGIICCSSQCLTALVNYQRSIPS